MSLNVLTTFLYGTNHPQRKQRTRAPRVCCACHTRANFMIDTREHAPAVFAHAVTRTRSFCTRGNTHTKILHTR